MTRRSPAARRHGARRALRRAFRDFLALPSAIVVAFVALAVASSLVERADVAGLVGLRRAMRRLVFSDPEATAALLGTLAGGLVTVASITFSLLLLAVQQSAAALTTQVYDQFLRRRLNQGFFGFFVGLALYCLVVLATVRPAANPVLGATLALVLAAGALYFLIVLIYATIDQARPSSVVAAIHDHTLAAEVRHAALRRRTRRTPVLPGPGAVVEATENGFVTGVDLDALEEAARRAGGHVEVVLRVAVGSYVAHADALGEVRGAGPDAGALRAAVAGAVAIERTRDLDRDPAYGVDQLANIAWTTISTSKQNPDPGRQVVFALRDLLARWSVPEEEREAGGPPAPVVYDDDVVAGVLDALESVAVVSSESMQHQCYAEVLRTFAALFDRLGDARRARVEDAVLRLLSALGDLVLTAGLDDALRDLAGVLDAGGRPGTAAALRRAHDALAASVGELNSRSTRVPTGGGAR